MLATGVQPRDFDTRVAFSQTQVNLLQRERFEVIIQSFRKSIFWNNLLHTFAIFHAVYLCDVIIKREDVKVFYAIYRSIIQGYHHGCSSIKTRPANSVNL